MNGQTNLSCEISVDNCFLWTLYINYISSVHDRVDEDLCEARRKIVEVSVKFAREIEQRINSGLDFKNAAIVAEAEVLKNVLIARPLGFYSVSQKSSSTLSQSEILFNVILVLLRHWTYGVDLLHWYPGKEDFREILENQGYEYRQELLNVYKAA